MTEPIDLDDLLAEDDAALDFAAEPEPLDGADLLAINRRLAALSRDQRDLARYDAGSKGNWDLLEAKQAAERAELEDRIKRGRAPLVGKVEWRSLSLERTHAEMVANDPTLTRVVFNNGVLTSRAATPEYVYDDEAEALKFCKANLADAVRYPDPPAALAKDPLKQACKDATLRKLPNGDWSLIHDDGKLHTADGKVVPGVTVRIKPREFTPETAGLES